MRDTPDDTIATLRVVRGGKKRMANYATVRAELRSNPDLAGFVARDDFAQIVILRRPIPGAEEAAEPFTPRPWRDDDAAELAAYLNDKGFRRLSIGIVRDVVSALARGAAFHPLREFLAGLAWDKTNRLGRLFLDHCGAVAETAQQTAYVEAVTRAFFISAVARIFQPGCKADHMLVLEGLQGILKSRLLRTLAVNDEWFSDSLPHSLEGKEARAHLAGRWIIEMSELAQFRGASIDTLKSFLSCQTDKFRPPYGRHDISCPRQCVFAGTTNLQTYLHDPTGERRFWPVRLTDIRLAAIRPLVPQLWAEAVHAFQAREQWWLSPGMEKIAGEIQGERRGRDPWFFTIAKFVAEQAPGEWFSTRLIFSRLELEEQFRKRADEMRIGDVLTELGCEHMRKQTTGVREWGWRTPLPAPAAPHPERE